jgi:hypothetical protein
MNNGCGQIGAIQTRGTCWFFSILNGFMLSENGQKILYNKLKNFYKKLKPEEKAYFDDGFNAPCPMKDLTKTKEIYFWKFVDQYLCFMSGPREVSLKAGKSADLLGAMSLQGTLAKQTQGGKGAFPQDEIGKILDHVGFAKDYYIKYADDPPKFHAGRKPQFVVVRKSKYYPRKYMNEIPLGLMADPGYELVCASLVIANTKADNSHMHKWHAVAGYVCNGKGYIYDSNQRKVFRCDWWKRADFVKVVNEEVAQHYSFFKGGQVDVHTYGFAIFARKAFVKDIGVSCLMKYRAKTPMIYGLNFTDPNLGQRLNNPDYLSNLKPAQRIAIKRRWAQTEHKAAVYVNKATFNSILSGAKNRNNGYQKVFNLQNAGYKIKNENFKKFNSNLMTKFAKKNVAPAPMPKKVSPNSVKTYTFTEAKAHLNQFTKSTAAVRKHQYSFVWKSIPMVQRKVLMHWRNKGEWLANNAFVNKAKPPIKRKTPSPSPTTKRATQVRANFNKYWKTLGPNNRQVVRNYVAAYKSPSPAKNSDLNAAKRNVNQLRTAKDRKHYHRMIAGNLSLNNWMNLNRYIKKKNLDAQLARSAKRAAKV